MISGDSSLWGDHNLASIMLGWGWIILNAAAWIFGMAWIFFINRYYLPILTMYFIMTMVLNYINVWLFSFG